MSEAATDAPEQENEAAEPTEKQVAEGLQQAEERANELVAAAPQPTGIEHRRRGNFDKGQMDLIRSTVAKDANPGELAMFLEICARYQLDPFAKQIWCAKFQSSGPVTIMVSRDGLLSLANRSKDFEGMDGDVVRSNDRFNKLHSPEGVAIEHEVTHAAPKDRGDVVGAWAVVYRTGRRPTYFFAPLEQYKKDSRGPWQKQLDAMILKVAESMALRKAFSISGVVGEDEMAPQRAALTASGAPATPDIEWPENEELADELRSAFKALGYTQAKIRLKVNGKSEDELRALLTELSNEAEMGEEVAGEVVS